jgi:hypothetical protein
MDTGPGIVNEIERYLRSGDSDPHRAAWPGGFMERGRRAHDDLRDALVREVRRRVGARTHHPPREDDVLALTRRKVGPMVRGLFPRAEQDAVLAVLERSVVVLTSANIEPLLRGHGFDGSAWTLANLYLASQGAEPLGDEAPRLIGLSEGTTCYVSLAYVAEDDDPFADVVVHEAAHVFHNCKRETLGLRRTRTKEWLLEIAYRKRETFAYACEAYARVLERAMTPADRRALAAEYGRAVRVADERVEAAAAARNGWKVILARCAPTSRPRSVHHQARQT